MAEEKHYSIVTYMEERDNRNFIFIRAFKQNSAVLLPLGMFSLIGAVAIFFAFKDYSIAGAAKALVFSAGIVVAVFFLRLEMSHRKRVKADKSGAIGSRTVMEFFNNYMSMETSIATGVTKISYKDFYGMVETSSYYILYYSRSHATLLRKKDIEEGIKESFGEFIRKKFEGKYRKL